MSFATTGIQSTVLVTWTVYQGDVGVTKLMTIVDSTYTVRNLTGMTGATLKIYRPGFNDASYEFATITCSIPSPPTMGQVQWVVGATDLANVPPGTYAASIILTAAGGYQEHTLPFTFYVRAAP